MLINYFLLILVGFTIFLGILNAVWLQLQKENEIISCFIEIIKLILPIFALISLFLPLDYYSFWFIAYVSIYYVLDALYNLLGKISLRDINGDKFKPHLLEQITRKMLSSFTIMYILSFHLLMHNTISKWLVQSIIINIISITGLVILAVFIFMGFSLIIYDVYTIIEFPIFNHIINKTAKTIKQLTYKTLLKKINFIDKHFVFLFKPEIETQINLKNIKSVLNNKFSTNDLNNKLTEKDQQFIVEVLSKFQNSYIK